MCATAQLRKYTTGAHKPCAHKVVSAPAMASRKLGGGRILGSGKGLAPPVAPSHRRTNSLLSPSESSVNSDNSASPLTTSPLPELTQDLTSIVSLNQNNGGSAVAAATSKLVCPICNEEMVSLSFHFWRILN